MSVGIGDELMDAPIDEDCMVDDAKIKKNLLSDFTDDSPIKLDEGMPPPPAPAANDSSDNMKVFLRIRPLSEEEKKEGEDQVCIARRPSTVVF